MQVSDEFAEEENSVSESPNCESTVEKLRCLSFTDPLLISS